MREYVSKICGVLAVFAISLAGPPGRAQEDDSSSPLSRLARHIYPGAHDDGEVVPRTVADVGKQLDWVAEKIRNDGPVVLKHPDVYSQARMTKYRRDFEAQLRDQLTRFQPILSARIARVDQASIDSQTSLAGSLAPPGTKVVVTAPTTTTPPVAPALSGTARDPSFVALPTLAEGVNKLGLEPTVVLDELKRYLDHLNEIRRVNLGDDISDSAGYGLYLVRMPVSITPGERTVEGFGAQMTVTARHEFPPDFLATTFRNLVINDLVDVLGPPLYEYVRASENIRGQLDVLAATKADREKKRDDLTARYAAYRATLLKNPLAELMRSARPARSTSQCFPPRPEFILSLSSFLNRATLPPVEPANAEATASIARRLDVLANTLATIDSSGEEVEFQEALPRQASRLRSVAPAALKGNESLIEATLSFLVDRYLLAQCSEDLLQKLLVDLADTALSDDKAYLDRALAFEQERRNDEADLAATTAQLAATVAQRNQLLSRMRTTSFASSRNTKRQYPISPGEVQNFFLTKNLLVLADDIAQTRATQQVHATDVRNYLRHQLSVAFDLMSRPVSRPSQQPGQPVQWLSLPPPLSRVELLDTILLQVQQRFFQKDLPQLHDGAFLEALPANLANRPMGALCWAVAVDAALLDDALRNEVRVLAAAGGFPCPNLPVIRFYWPSEEASAAFNAYVVHRWPIITFAVDPVTDQQNILDSFSLRRDLQLALAFAFSTGQIGFNQLNTFRRKLEQDSETIALNKTVTAFTHGNETFGWRFYPRFQNPPSQSNFGTLASTLIYGGPKPTYGLRKSKIEPGQRELTAVIIMPSFLPTVRVEASGNWFRLDDPEHLVISTKRMLEEGRKVQEVRQALGLIGDSHEYRATDMRHLSVRVDQVEQMLPIQSQLVSIPFDSAANGFDLFTAGATALVPELSGFEGAEQAVEGQRTDLLLFGRFFSIHETRLVAGGRAIPEDTGNTGAGAGFEILSREVMRLTLPADVQPTATLDNQPMVDVYLATPNGISNRLMVPYRSKTTTTPPPPGEPPKDPSGTRKTTTTGTVTIDLTKKEFPATGASGGGGGAAQSGGSASTPTTFPKGVSGTTTPTGFTPATAGAGAHLVPRNRPPTPVAARPTPGPGRDPSLVRASAAEPAQTPVPVDLEPIPSSPGPRATLIPPAASPPTVTTAPPTLPAAPAQVPADTAAAVAEQAAAAADQAAAATAGFPISAPSAPVVITPPAPIMIMTQEVKPPEPKRHSFFSGLRKQRKPASVPRP